jgi:succinate dehydrogenase flavin-adding protein (antitoxin of CptAB toxin-antitoxin module)
MTLDISSSVLPTLQESAMTHLNTLLATQDPSLLSWLMSSKRKDTIKRVKETMSMLV